MTDLGPITNVGDAWVNALKTGLNTGSNAWVQVKSGERRGFVWPPMPTIAGRTVLAASLVGRVGPGHVGQTYTAAPVTARWSPGRVTWANQPAVNLAAAVTTTVAALPDGGLVEFDLTAMAAAVAAGTPWFGVRITTGSTTAGQVFYATDSGRPAWEFNVTLSDLVDQPSNLRPDAGAVSTARPVLAWDPVDLGGVSTEQAQIRVQVDTPAIGGEPDDVTPDFDTGWVSATEPQYDLAASAHTPPTTDTRATYWRVWTKDLAGTESEPSDWASYTTAALPTLVVDSPVGAFGDPSPTLLAHLTGGTVSTWKARVTGPDRSDVRAETGTQSGAIAWQIPERNKDQRRVLREDEAGWIHLRVWDDVDRAVAVGQNPYVEEWIPAEYDEDLGVGAPSWLSISSPGDDPRLRWTWHRTEAADAWLLKADGVTLARLDAEDVTVVGAGTYTYTDNGLVAPLRPQHLTVHAVEGSASSVGTTYYHDGHTVEGLWLLPDGIDPILCDGTAVGDFAGSDRSATYTPLSGPDVEIVYDWNGITGAFTGSVDNRDGDVWDTLARIEALRTSRNRIVRMVWGSESIAARISDLSAVPAEEITESNLLHVVRFRFTQVGD